MDELEEIIQSFLVESAEGLAQVEQDLVLLEKDPEDGEAVKRITRVLHTIKGTCGFLGFENLEELTHVAESTLIPIRDGQRRFDTRLADVLLDVVDRMRGIFAQIETEGTEHPQPHDALVERLKAIEADEPEPETEAQAAPEPVTETADTQTEGPEAVGTEAEEPTSPPPTSADPKPPAAMHADPAHRGDTTIRVDVRVLDRLMNLVGELVLSRNQLVRSELRETSSHVGAALARLSSITTELQEGIMKTRMQPVKQIWGSVPRIVRDVSKVAGKDVELALTGADTEIDRGVLDAIKDPLLHLVRNAVDHGVEPPDVRERNGKPRAGTLSVHAYHENGFVGIRIKDDGAGIDPGRIRAKALERGLIDAAAAERMSDRDLVSLIFAPGFSTAEKVTNISGRGVGMDVVKTSIERIGGVVEVDSTIGAGTTFQIKLPLTLAIVPALVVRAEGERYALPQATVQELIRIREGAIERVQDAFVYRLRGQLMPLVSLGEMLQLHGGILEGAMKSERDGTLLVINADGKTFGLVVDEVADSEEIVVKPLGTLAGDLGVFGGATILGDGRVALILDPLGLAQQAALAEEASRSVTGTMVVDEDDLPSEKDSLLVCLEDEGRRVAFPLAQVARLEEVAPEEVERSHGRPVVQYHGRLLPLVNAAAGRDMPLMHVVVRETPGGPVGVVVREVLDVIERQTEGERGSIVVDGKVTDLLALDDMIARERPELLDGVGNAA